MSVTTSQLFYPQNSSYLQNKANTPKLPLLVPQTCISQKRNEEDRRNQSLLPPKLGDSAMLSLYRFGKEEEKILKNVQESEAAVKELSDTLRTIKQSVDEAFKSQMLTQSELEKCPPREQMEHLLTLKCRQQQDLMETLKLEEKYTKELNCALKKMREARISAQSFNIHLKSSSFCDNMENGTMGNFNKSPDKNNNSNNNNNTSIENVYKLYESRKSLLYRQRLYREQSIKSSMKKYEFQAMKNLLDSSIQTSLEKSDESRSKSRPSSSVAGTSCKGTGDGTETDRPASKKIDKKEAMKRMRVHIRNTTRHQRKLRENHLLSQHIKSSNQRQNLIFLKQKIEEQKEALKEGALIHKKKQQLQAERRAARRQKLIDEGENPFVVDKLMEVQDKLEENEIKVMQSKAEALQKIERDMATKERTRNKEMMRRRYWDKFWEKKAREKKIQKYHENVLNYLGEQNSNTNQVQNQSPSKSRDSRHDKWMQVAKEIYGYDPNGKRRKKCPKPRGKVYLFNNFGQNEEFDEFEEEEDEEEENEEEEMLDLSKKIVKIKSKSKTKLKSKSKSKSKLQKEKTSKVKLTKKKTKENIQKVRSKTGNKSDSAQEENQEQEDFEEEENIEQILAPRNLKSRQSENEQEIGIEDIQDDGQCDFDFNYELDFVAGGDDGIGRNPLMNYNVSLHGIPAPSSTSTLGVHKSKMNLKSKPIFSWSPKIISFKNYDPEKVYKVKVYVTNKSRERLKYYFKELTEISPTSNAPLPLNPPPTANSTGNIGDASQGNVVAELEDKDENKSKVSIKSVKKKKSKKSILKSGRSTSRNSNKSLNLQEQDENSNNDENNQLQQLSSRIYKLSDLITVDFNVPSPISPGLQHSFIVKFKPPQKVKEMDRDGQLHFTSEMETFTIPLEIRKKRFSPVWIHEINSNSNQEKCSLSFINTVVQTSIIKKVRIKNEGALAGFISQIFEPNPPKNFNEIEYYESRESAREPFNVKEKENQEKLFPVPPEQEQDQEQVPQKGKGKKTGTKKSTVRINSKTKKSPRSTSQEPIENIKSEKKILKKKKSRSKTRSAKSLSFMPDDEDGAKNVLTSNENDGAQVVEQLLNNLLEHITENIFVSYVDEMTRKIEPGKSVTLSVLYRPPFLSNFTTSYDISFQHSGDDNDNGNGTDQIQNLVLDVTGTTVENPIVIQPINSEFKICMIGQNYQQIVRAFATNHKGSGKVKAQIPAVLKGIVDVHPQEGATLFSTHPCEFSIKFMPKKYILTSPERYREYYDPETHIIDFPIYFHLKFPYKLPSPIKATFMAIISDTALVVDPEDIDLGECLSNETVKTEVTIFNPTFVTQEIGFVDVPNEILIQPNYGFGSILPDESIKFDILYSPSPSPTLSNGIGSTNYNQFEMDEWSQSLQLKLKSMANEEYHIRLKCRVRTPIAKLSHNKITFPVTCCGSTSRQVFDIKAASKSYLKGSTSFLRFQIACDPTIPVKFIPTLGYLEPGKQVRIEVKFEASVTEDQVRMHVVEMAKKRHLERIDTYQRELSSINLHIQNGWMLEENAGISKSHSSSRASLLSAKISNPELSKALQKIALRKLLSANQTSQTDHENNQVPPESAVTSSSPGSATAPPNTAKTQSSNNSKNPDDPDDSSSIKNENGVDKPKTKTSQSSISTVASSKPRKTSKGESSGSGEKEQPLRQQLLTALEKRRTSVQAKIQETFNPPNTQDIRTDSVEFAKAKRDLMRNLPVSSKVFQIPIFVQDLSDAQHGNSNSNPNQEQQSQGQRPPDILYLTLKCPMQKPDLLLLDDSSIFYFGKVETGDSTYREISLYNVSSGYLKLKMSILDPYGPFQQVNALRDLAPEHVYTLKIKFTPMDSIDYEEPLSIYGNDSSISLILKGSGGIKDLQSVTTSTTHLGSLNPDKLSTASNPNLNQLTEKPSRQNQNQNENSEVPPPPTTSRKNKKKKK